MPALYSANLNDFVHSDEASIVGVLSQGSVSVGGITLAAEQVAAWKQQVTELREQARRLIAARSDAGSWRLLLEYTLPVIGRRPDAILLAGGTIFVIEYKAGLLRQAAGALAQAYGYALDLRDFHEESRGRRIVALALGELTKSRWRRDDVLSVKPSDLAQVVLDRIAEEDGADPIDAKRWEESRYFAVPTLIEAANAIYRDHDVAEISHSRAGADNLSSTLSEILAAAAFAKDNSAKVICFVTGVPGAGKTLAGLNAMSSLVRRLDLSRDQAAFLSGNAPLVGVLRRALAQTAAGRRNRRSLESVIQDMHRFVSDTWDSGHAPAHRAIIFDEAQRAWSRERNNKKYKRDISEPEMVLSIMGRHPGWALVVALVGGGQEIHAGEAGLAAWGEALRREQGWSAWASPEAMHGGRFVAGSRLFGEAAPPSTQSVEVRAALHLSVSKRSYETSRGAEWVNAVLSGDAPSARLMAGGEFPVFLTRSLGELRAWLRENVAPNRRAGLVASSGAARLRAEGIETPTFRFLQSVKYDDWFLKPEGDVRSSNQLEVAMSEFEMQGLELDYVGLLWGGDLLFDADGRPVQRRFKGSAWVKQTTGGHGFELTLNKYRGLLTRYRKAMAIFVPTGTTDDPTRPPEEFDRVAGHLRACGARELETTVRRAVG